MRNINKLIALGVLVLIGLTAAFMLLSNSPLKEYKAKALDDAKSQSLVTYTTSNTKESLIIAPKLGSQFDVKSDINRMVETLKKEHPGKPIVSSFKVSKIDKYNQVTLTANAIDDKTARLKILKSVSSEYLLKNDNKSPLSLNDVMLTTDYDKLYYFRHQIAQSILDQSDNKKINLVDLDSYINSNFSKLNQAVAINNNNLTFTIPKNDYGVTSVSIPGEKLRGFVDPKSLTVAKEPAHNKNDKLIALTIDDGPDEKYGLQLQKTLKEKDVPATLFYVGSFAQKNSEVAKKAHEAGFEIGNHSWAHEDLSTISAGQVTTNVQNSSQAIYEASGFYPYFFRFPYGNNNAAAVQAVGMPSILWNVTSGDSVAGGLTEQQFINNVVNTVKTGGIILMHETHPTSVAGVASAIDKLREKGYTFVSLEELFDYQVNPGHNYYGVGDVR